MDVHLVLDNYGTHKTPLIQRWLLRHPRYHLHFTPKGGSWINQVERFFSDLTTKQLRRGVHRSTVELETSIREYITAATSTRNPSSGQKPPTKSWLPSSGFVSESLGRHTRSRRASMPAPTVRAVVALALSSTIAPGAAAWGPTGHRTVARIAEHHLNPRPLKRSRTCSPPEQLAFVATWPDEIRSEQAFDDGAERVVLLGEALRVHTGGTPRGGCSTRRKSGDSRV
jgi:hypothetical protein